MARAKSEEKRQAILRAAVREIARSGLGASTAKIAKGADVAEGTLFTYFATKNELLNELYVEIKGDVYRRVNAGFPLGGKLRERARHVWIETMHWAMECPAERKVSAQLNLSEVVTDATRERTREEGNAVAQAMLELAARGAFKDFPAAFAGAAISAMQDAVRTAVANNPKQKKVLVEKGFEAFWRLAK